MTITRPFPASMQLWLWTRFFRMRRTPRMQSLLCGLFEGGSGSNWTTQRAIYEDPVITTVDGMLQMLECPCYAVLWR